MNNSTYDVIIVGAGFSGLSAALKLKKQKKSFILLEARNRVGGRSWTEQYINQKTGATCWIDMGAQWVEKTQTEIIALAEEMKIPANIGGMPRKGKIIFIFKNKRYEVDLTKNVDNNCFPIFSKMMEEYYLEDFKEYHDSEEEMNEMAKTLEAGKPWNPNPDISKKNIKKAQKNISKWDSMTAESWMEQNMKSDGAQFLFRIKCLLCFAAPPSDLSLLHVLHYINCAGGSQSLNNATQYRIEGGTQAIANAVYDKIKSHVRLNEPVQEVIQPDPNLIINDTLDVTLVKTKLGTYKSKQVIIAIPPAIVSKINFTPQLPARRMQFNQRMPMGSSIKCHLVYEDRFWENEGFSGVALSDKGILPFIANNSVPNRETPGVLGCFIDSEEVRKLMNDSEEEIEKYVIKAIEEVFEPSVGTVPKPKKVYIANWSNETWSGGCYAGIMPPGIWTGYKNTLREPVGSIHWATTETANKWFAYMDGAVRAGKMASEEVIKILDKNTLREHVGSIHWATKETENNMDGAMRVGKMTSEEVIKILDKKN